MDLFLKEHKQQSFTLFALPTFSSWRHLNNAAPVRPEVDVSLHRGRGTMLRQGIFALGLCRRRPPGARSAHSDRKIMQKIVTNHSTNCPGLVDVLKKFVGQNYDSVIRCNPARISRARGSSENFDLRVNSQIGDTGSFKCIARSGTIVQDVYIMAKVTSPTSKIQSVEDLENQINLCLPRRAKKTKLRKARERSNAQCTVSSDEEKLLEFF